MIKCWKCGYALGPSDFARADTCHQCGKATRVCKNCEWYDRNYNNECKENQADRVVDKEQSNFCDYFKPNPNAAGPSQAATSRDAMKAAAEALFKKSGGSSS